MSSYQLPSSAFETIHCRQEDTPKECDVSFWTDKNIVASNMERSNETAVAYNPVFERHHGVDSLHTKEYHALHDINGWKEVLMN